MRAGGFNLALLCMAWTWSLSSHAIDITDQRGVTVHFEKSPQRIVSLLPSLTEGVCALDQCGRLIGVDRYSNSPASVKALPKLGGFSKVLSTDKNIADQFERTIVLKPLAGIIVTVQ